MFNVTKETKSSNTYEFAGTGIHPNVVLVSVGKHTYGDAPNQKTALKFQFKNNEGREFSHLEFPFEATDSNAATKVEGMCTRIAHIYRAFGLEIPEGAMVGASFSEFTDNVIKTFNGTEPDAVPIYKGVSLYIKIVYNKANTLAFPYSPNFIEKMIPNKHTMLVMNPKFDKLKATEKTAATYGAGGDGAGAPAGNFEEIPV